MYKIGDKIQLKHDKNTYKVVYTYFIGFASHAIVENIDTYENKEVLIADINKKVK